MNHNFLRYKYDTMSTKNHQLPILRFMTESGSEETHYPLVYDGLPEEFKFLAEEELKETEDKKLNGIQMLKDHIRRKNLHSIPEYLLVVVLRACKYDTKKSKSKVEKLIKERKEIAERVIKLGLKEIELIMDNFNFLMFPYRDKHGSAMIYTRTDGFDLDVHSLEDFSLYSLLSILFILQIPLTTVSGLTYLPDFNIPSVSFVYPIVKCFYRMLPHMWALPIRVSKVGVLNPFPMVYTTYRIANRLIPPKIAKRVCFYSKGYDTLQKDYNKNILPDELDGNAGPLTNSHIKENILEFAENLIDEYK